MKPLASLVIAIAVCGVAAARPKLRPEHLEPMRVEEPAAKPAIPKARPARVATRTPDPEPAIETPRPRTSGRPADLVARGTQLYLAGSFKDAVAAYRQALAIDGGYAPAHRALGIAYQRMGLASLAIASLRRYLALAPQAGDAAAIEARIERLGGSR
jgi:tetratricopeptide (TPR) repeat protein